jgi:hypothetical protein
MGTSAVGFVDSIADLKALQPGEFGCVTLGGYHTPCQRDPERGHFGGRLSWR